MINLAFGLLSIGPRIRRRQGRLVLETRLRTIILTLGLRWRRVVVDPDARTITIDTLKCWAFRSKQQLSFDEVVAIVYGYSDASPYKNVSTAHNAIDVYRVGLRLLGDKEIILFRFIGDGGWTINGYDFDWTVWEGRNIDLSGTQDRDSLVLVNLLSELLGRRVRPPR